MRYYQISFDVETTGLKNGIHQIEVDLKSMKESAQFKEFLDFFSSRNINFWDNQDKITTLKTVPPIKSKIIKKAKLTDIMAYTPKVGFFNNLYSEKYINILRAFYIGNYDTFEVVIENVLEKYYLLFIETIISKEINYEHSIVYIGHKVLKNIEYHRFQNYHNYWAFKQINPLAKFEKVSISQKYLSRDIIKIQGLSSFYSEKLIDFLLNCGITGLKVDYKNSIQLEFV
jgi:hypothetical protein